MTCHAGRSLAPLVRARGFGVTPKLCEMQTSRCPICRYGRGIWTILRPLPNVLMDINRLANSGLSCMDARGWAARKNRTLQESGPLLP